MITSEQNTCSTKSFKIFQRLSQFKLLGHPFRMPFRNSSRWKIRSIRKDILSLCLLCTWTVQLATPQSSPPSPSTTVDIHELICRLIPGLNENERQVQLCAEVPKAISILTKTKEVFGEECSWQFRKELWNCTGVDDPVFSRPTIRNTKESAFVYALTSALTVHQITTACSSGDLAPTCGCDVSRNGMTDPVYGWKWGSCSDNVSYGITYAQNFLDAREIEGIDNTVNDEVAMAEINLHNNAAGRRVVKDAMKLACKCHGLSGSCAVKTCWEELPSIYEIGDTVKELYDRAIKVEVLIPRGGGPLTMRYYDEEQDDYLIPSLSEIVYLDESPRYCAANANFTKQRFCMPSSTLASDRFYDTAMDEFFPACETFCCNGQYTAYHRTEVMSCNCTFVWCCEVVCQTCVNNVTEYRCTG